jgi:hypothetical protein
VIETLMVENRNKSETAQRVAWGRRFLAATVVVPPSAMPSMATKSVRRNEPTRCARTRHPATHSITSSARTIKDDGTSKPRAFAVFRLTAVVYLVGACTGMSAGLPPRRMRST